MRPEVPQRSKAANYDPKDLRPQNGPRNGYYTTPMTPTWLEESTVTDDDFLLKQLSEGLDLEADFEKLLFPR